VTAGRSETACQRQPAGRRRRALAYGYRTLAITKGGQQIAPYRPGQLRISG
jgi:hypothetical protein